MQFVHKKIKKWRKQVPFLKQVAIYYTECICYHITLNSTIYHILVVEYTFFFWPCDIKVKI